MTACLKVTAELFLFEHPFIYFSRFILESEERFHFLAALWKSEYP